MTVNKISPGVCHANSTETNHSSPKCEQNSSLAKIFLNATLLKRLPCEYFPKHYSLASSFQASVANKPLYTDKKS